MPRPNLSQYPTVAEFQAAFNAWHATVHDFSEKVDKICEDQYDLCDGGDLCYNLVEQGVIDPANGEDAAARVVAQHIQQA